MAGNFSPRRRAAGRRGWRTRVLVGLSPVWLLGGFMLADRMQAPGDRPVFAGSAAVAQDIHRLTPAGTPGGDVVRTAAAPAGADAEPARVVLASLAPADPLPQAAAPAAPAIAAEQPEDSRVLRSPVGPEQRARTFDGWRTAPGAGTEEEGERLAAAGTVVVPQPRWDRDDDRLAAVPVPEPRPGWLRAPAPVERPHLPQAAERGAERPAIPQRISDARVVIHGTPAAASAARQLSEVLDVRGAGETEIRRVESAPSEADVRYFHERDRAAAEAVNRLLRREGYGSEVKDFTDFDPPPSRGTVEVWLPG